MFEEAVKACPGLIRAVQIFAKNRTFKLDSIRKVSVLGDQLTVLASIDSCQYLANQLCSRAKATPYTNKFKDFYGKKIAVT